MHGARCTSHPYHSRHAVCTEQWLMIMPEDKRAVREGKRFYLSRETHVTLRYAATPLPHPSFIHHILPIFKM